MSVVERPIMLCPYLEVLLYTRLTYLLGFSTYYMYMYIALNNNYFHTILTLLCPVDGM